MIVWFGVFPLLPDPVDGRLQANYGVALVVGCELGVLDYSLQLPDPRHQLQLVDGLHARAVFDYSP